jgi:oligoribonuclease (3'-5' exoribonuclease)
VSDDLVQRAKQKICERRHFTISELSREFPQISLIVLYKLTTVRLCYHEFCARWIPKMLKGAHKTQRMASDFTF